MANLKDFFRDLLNWEAQQTYEPTDEIPQALRNEAGVIYEDADLKSSQRSVELIHQWPQELCDTIVSAFKKRCFGSLSERFCLSTNPWKFKSVNWKPSRKIYRSKTGGRYFRIFNF